MTVESADSRRDIGPLGGVPSEAEAVELCREAVAYFGGIREIGEAGAFLKKHLKPGRIFIYGAGTHSQAILATLTARTDVTILGFIDQRAATRPVFEGFPVITVDELAGRDYDYILISYNRMEKTLVDRLLAAGVEADRIMTIYSNPDFIAASTEDRFARIAARLGDLRFDHVIVHSGVHEILSNAILARVFPPDRTLMIHIGNPGRYPTDGYFWTVDACECMALLHRILAHIRPKLVFAATAREFDLCSLVVKNAVPEAFFIHEIYDFFEIIPEDWLKIGIGAGDRLIALMRAADAHSSQVADVVISKRSGSAWMSAQSAFAADYRFVFPGIGAERDPARQCVHDPDQRPPSSPVRILYAGALVPSDFDVYRRSDYNFMPLLRDLADHWNYDIDVYNSSHAEESNDHNYTLYLEKYNSGSLRYHRRIPFEYLLKMMPRYHYGWLCLPPRERRLVDQRVVICNRFSAYIFGCLPIIVDREWTFIAELVDEFDAGLVIDDTSPENIAATIERSDNAKKRQGASRLAQHMQRHNCAVLDQLRTWVLDAEYRS